tara:strand:- start:6800 stop:7408 length:609 start_codon:yes stop_codon:yes gene_type:complete
METFKYRDREYQIGQTFNGGTQGQPRRISNVLRNATTHTPTRVEFFYGKDMKLRSCCQPDNFFRWVDQWLQKPGKAERIDTVMSDDPFSIVYQDCCNAVRYDSADLLDWREGTLRKARVAFDTAVQHPFCDDETMQFFASLAAVLSHTRNPEARQYLTSCIRKYREQGARLAMLASSTLYSPKGRLDEGALVKLWIELKREN